MSTVKVTIKGDKEVLQSLRKMGSRVSNTGALMARVSVLGFQDVMDHFRNKDGSEGPWKPLKSSTIKRRRKNSSVPLQDTGRLRTSILPSATINEAKVSTNLSYAQFHNFGTQRIPKREFMWLSDTATQRVLGMFSRWVVRGSF